MRPFYNGDQGVQSWCTDVDGEEHTPHKDVPFVVKQGAVSYFFCEYKREW